MDKYIDGLYEMSADFRAYVDKYCSDYGYTVDEALEHALICEVAKYYWGQEEEKEKGGAARLGKKYTGDLGNGLPAV